jgi:hypothetical protein
MNDHVDNVVDLNAILHPGCVYDHPRDVVADAKLSISEKRAILASWVSDAAAVTSNPALREIPGSRRIVTVDDGSRRSPRSTATRRAIRQEAGRTG